MKMKNLSSINHENFSRLYELTNSYNKATLLDKLIYWWQISKFTLPNSPHIWFTRSRERIAEESKLSLRTIDRYINEFTKEGLIEKTNKLFLKKNLYIRITDKLLLSIGLSNQDVTSAIKNITPIKAASEIIQNHSTQEPGCKKSDQHGSIDFANLAVSIYKEQDNNLINNTVKDESIVNNFQNQKIKTTTQQSNINHYPQYPVEKIIGEQLTPQFTNYIKGTLQNLKTQHHVKISSPEQLYAEVVFTILNKQHQFIGITDNIHRVNLIAKLLRENRWRTPKGFFNHSEIGKYFKNSNKEKKSMKPEVGEGMIFLKKPENDVFKKPTPNKFNIELKQTQQKLHEINLIIHTETRYLQEMQLINKTTPSKITQIIIDSTAIKIANLHTQMGQLQNQIKCTNAA